LSQEQVDVAQFAGVAPVATGTLQTHRLYEHREEVGLQEYEVLSGTRTRPQRGFSSRALRFVFGVARNSSTCKWSLPSSNPSNDPRCEAVEQFVVETHTRMRAQVLDDQGHLTRYLLTPTERREILDFERQTQRVRTSNHLCADHPSFLTVWI
jgi:hypothetical protein